MASTQPTFYHSTVARFLSSSKGVWSAFLLFHMWVASFPSTNLIRRHYQEEFRGEWMMVLSHQQIWMHRLSASSITDRLYPSCLTRNQSESTSELLLLFSIWPKLGSSYQVFGASWIRASPLQLCCCQPIVIFQKSLVMSHCSRKAVSLCFTVPQACHLQPSSAWWSIPPTTTNNGHLDLSAESLQIPTTWTHFVKACTT